jgi:hypothetical protein
MKRAAAYFVLLVFAATSLSSCSMLTAQGRQQRAYEKYVAKYSKRRAKEQSLIARLRAKIPSLTPSEPVVSTSVADGPESVTSPGGGL